MTPPLRPLTPRETAAEQLNSALRNLDQVTAITPQRVELAIETAKLHATIAIASALLDVADAIREFAASERGEVPS